MPSITATTLKFDSQKLIATIPDVKLIPEFADHLQLSVTHSSQASTWFDSVGSLFDYTTKQFTRKTSDYTTLNQHFAGTYMEQVIAQVTEQAQQDGVKIGRIRFMYLLPKTCYTLHIDLEEFRYHIPLVSNKRCFFVNNDVVERMCSMGQLYRFRTKELHTAVNASTETRIHLVFDTYK